MNEKNNCAYWTESNDISYNALKALHEFRRELEIKHDIRNLEKILKGKALDDMINAFLADDKDSWEIFIESSRIEFNERQQEQKVISKWKKFFGIEEKYIPNPDPDVKCSRCGKRYEKHESLSCSTWFINNERFV